MEKLKNRLDAFSDAIIAIIITIMVLNIPPVLHDSWANYLALGKNVGIYLISFIFIANIWYQHSTAFNEIDTMTYRILILDMLFIGPLALMPLLTNMMAVNTTRVTVMLYGGLLLFVNFMFRALTRAIIHLQYDNRDEMRKVYNKVFGNINLALDGLAIVALAVAFFQPEWALIFYLAYPILMFLVNANARQQMYDVAALPATQQADFVQLDNTGRREFRKAQAQAFGEASATKANKGDMPAAWSNWLDQNVDPRRREMIQHRYASATPEQQAKMTAWFDYWKAADRQRRGKRQAR